MSATRSLKISRNNCILCPLRKLLHERFKVTRISWTESMNSAEKTNLYFRIYQTIIWKYNITSHITNNLCMLNFGQMITEKEIVKTIPLCG